METRPPGDPFPRIVLCYYRDMTLHAQIPKPPKDPPPSPVRKPNGGEPADPREPPDERPPPAEREPPYDLPPEPPPAVRG